MRDTESERKRQRGGRERERDESDEYLQEEKLSLIFLYFCERIERRVVNGVRRHRHQRRVGGRRLEKRLLRPLVFALFDDLGPFLKYFFFFVTDNEVKLDDKLGCFRLVFSQTFT
jgi:hypothetical protein